MVDLFTIVHLSISSMHKPVATERSESNTHCRSILHLGVSASFVLQTTAKGSIGTHCTIPIVSTLVTSNLLTTRISHCLLHPQVSILRMTSNFRRISASSDEFHALTILSQNLKHLFPLALQNLAEAIFMTKASSVKSMN